VIVPRPDTSDTSPSSSEPSHLQTGIDFATTIQFPHGTRGDTHGGGIIPFGKFGQKHMAVPIPRVSVGVQKIRNVLTEGGPIIHHAPNEHGGHTPGKGGVPGQIVNPANMGIPDKGVIFVGINGIPNSVGELPGARGAQFRGKFRQDPPPNPHESPSRRFCVISITEFTAPSSNQILN
jgi:hypothetical protein